VCGAVGHTLRRAAYPLVPSLQPCEVCPWRITGDTNDGMASLDFYGWKPVALIWDACGCLLGYFVEDTDLNSDDGKRVVYGHAIGVCEGVTNTDCLNGLHIEDFVSA
jgi:hypothetical protein